MITLLTALLTVSPASAQDLELPVLSPRASATQQIGTVTVTVDYASPGKRDRTVWGELVPYGELWRTGANGATTLETTGDLKIGGKDVKAGTYAIFSIPGEKEWTLIVNSNPNQGGTGSYDEKLDVVRVKATPSEGPDRERLTFVFADTDEDSASLDLEWAGVRVALPIEVDSAGRANASIDGYVGRVPRRLADAGRYKAEHGDIPGGLALIEQSITVKPTWYGHWQKALTLKDQGNAKDAYKAAQEAMKLGEAAGNGFFYKDRVEKALAEWPKK